jgi:two-component system, NarL family, nitrate/nitrite response regulator NarL
VLLYPQDDSGLERKAIMANLIPIPTTTKAVVLVADNTPMNTQLLAGALAEEKRFQVIESPPAPAAISALVKRDKPHVAVISATLTGTGGAWDFVRDLRSLSPSTRVIVLLNASERELVIKAFRAGAQGVFCRTEPIRLLAKCIECVHGGQIWANSSQLQFLLDALGGPARPRFTPETQSLLSPREIDVVVGLTEGLSNREIARRLKLTEHTVKNYLSRIFEKLGASSRVEVILLAIRSPASSCVGDSARHSERTLHFAGIGQLIALCRGMFRAG